MRRRISFSVTLSLLAAVLVVQGCSTNGPSLRSASDRFGKLSPDRQALADANCYDGLPVDTREPRGSTELIVRRGYVLEHSSRDKIPLWVCESVFAAQLQGQEKRSNRFKADPDLEGPKAYPQDYVGSGYDRGHQAPAGNQTVDAELKAQTFYMSNMAPQRPSLNRGIWKHLEDKTRAWVLEYGHAYEWTGPIRCDAAASARGASRSDIGDNCQRATIGPHEVAVPVYFYKIILVRDQSAWKAIAFVLPNIDFRPPYHLEYYLTSIDWIEKRTGIEFMPRMSAHERHALSSTVASMWP